MQISSNDNLFNQKVDEFNQTLNGLKSKNIDKKAESATKCMSIIRQIGIISIDDRKKSEVYERLKASLNTFETTASKKTINKINKVLEILLLFIENEEKVSTTTNLPSLKKGSLYHVPPELIGQTLGIIPRDSFILSKKKEKTLLTDSIQKDKHLPEETLKDAEALIQMYEVLVKATTEENQRGPNKIHIPPLSRYDSKNKNSIFEASNEARNLLLEHGHKFKKLYFNNLNIGIIPYQFATLFPNVKRIEFIDCVFTDGQFPPEILDFQKLELLNLENTNIKNLPDDIGRLKNLKSLTFTHKDIYFAPKQIAPIIEPSKLPESFKLLTKLEELDLSFLNFTEVPTQLRELALLSKLDLRFNPIGRLPDWLNELSIKDLSIDLMFTKEFPNELISLEKLEHLRFSRWECNPKNFPDNIPELFPKLKSFFSYNKNIRKQIDELNKMLEKRNDQNEEKVNEIF